MTSCPEPEESITTFDLGTPTSTTYDEEQVKLNTSVVEQLVMAAVASLPTPTPTVLTTATSEPNNNIQLPPTPAPMDNSTTTTLTTTNDVTTPEINMTFTDAQIEQINVVQAQAIAQAAAAAMASSGTDYHQIFANLDAAAAVMNQQQQELQNNNNTITNTNNGQHGYKKEAITQKVRQENRERKKRWRQQNQERNKDNDLRCRVNKRAHKLFGKDDSVHKQKWVEDEFARRRAKRKEKEGRKHNLDGLSSPTPPTEEDAAALNGLLNDPSGYMSMIANNLNSLANGTALTSASQLNTIATTSMDVDMKDDKSEQFTTQLLEFLQQQQQQQQQQQHDFAAALNIKQEVEPAVVEEQQQAEDVKMEEQKEVVKEEPTVKDETTAATPQTKEDGQPVDYPIDAVLTLMQLNAGWRQ